MGFSVSAGTAILFLGVVLAFTTAYPTVANGYERVVDAEQDVSDRRLSRQNTAITLQNASYDGTDDTLRVVVENTGTTALSVVDTDLLVDNVYRTGSRTVAGDATTDVWLPGETLTVTVANVTARPDRVRIVTEYGVSTGGEV